MQILGACYNVQDDEELEVEFRVVRELGCDEVVQE